MGLQTTSVPLCPSTAPQGPGPAWTLADPSCKLEQGHEVWPHLQLLLTPLCLPVVPEAFKAPSSVEHSAPCPGPEEHTNLTGAAGLDWSGKVPRASFKSCPAAEGSLFQAEPLAQSLAVRQARAQLPFKVILVFPTLEGERAHESWQELRGRWLSVTLLISEPHQHLAQA